MGKALYIGGAALALGAGYMAWRHIGLDPEAKPAPLGTPLPAGIKANEVEIDKASPSYAVGAEEQGPSVAVVAPVAAEEPEAIVRFRLQAAAKRMAMLQGYEVQWDPKMQTPDLAEIAVVRLKLVPKEKGGAEKYAAAAATVGWDVGLGGTKDAPELRLQQAATQPPRGARRAMSKKRYHRLGGLYKPEANLSPVKGPISVVLIQGQKVPAGLLPQTPTGDQPQLLLPGANAVQKAVEVAKEEIKAQLDGGSKVSGRNSYSGRKATAMVSGRNAWSGLKAMAMVSGRNAWSGRKAGAMVSGWPRSTITGGWPRSDVIGAEATAAPPVSTPNKTLIWGGVGLAAGVAAILGYRHYKKSRNPYAY